MTTFGSPTCDTCKIQRIRLSRCSLAPHLHWECVQGSFEKRSGHGKACEQRAFLPRSDLHAGAAIAPLRSMKMPGEVQRLWPPTIAEHSQHGQDRTRPLANVYEICASESQLCRPITTVLCMHEVPRLSYLLLFEIDQHPSPQKYILLHQRPCKPTSRAIPSRRVT